MARFSEVVPSAGRYVNAADKAMLAADPEAEKADERADTATGPVAMRLVGATYQPRARFGPRWLIDASVLATGEVVAIDFAAANKDDTAIESRMTMFGELRDRLSAGEAFEPVVLVRVQPSKGGNPFWTFEDAHPEWIAKPNAPVWLDDVDAEPEPEPVKVGRRRLAKAGR